ncbi:MAG TPA: hypothetical protein VHF01_02420 [Candidatus Acidoferrum sp.]|nr:hypothetical protein [Candidatus Acidoferrum sp.]
MSKAAISLMVVIFISLAACTRTTNKSVVQNVDYGELRKLRIDHAVSDARESLAAKDIRLLAVRGYTVEVPGVREDVRAIECTYGIRIIEGTSDAIEGPEHQQLIANARAYAEKYNQTIVAGKKGGGGSD